VGAPVIKAKVVKEPLVLAVIVVERLLLVIEPALVFAYKEKVPCPPLTDVILADRRTK